MSDREEFEEAWAENGVANNLKIKHWCRQFWDLRQPELDALKAENKQLRSALKGLLSDTQHVEHEDCEYGPCPVRTARQILKETK